MSISQKLELKDTFTCHSECSEESHMAQYKLRDRGISALRLPRPRSARTRNDKWTMTDGHLGMRNENQCND